MLIAYIAVIIIILSAEIYSLTANDIRDSRYKISSVLYTFVHIVFAYILYVILNHLEIF